MKALTIITASKQNYLGLKNLYSQIKELRSELFWVIKDSGECTQTTEFFEALNEPFITYINKPDTGIYSALNTCLDFVNTDWYLTVGSDDNIFTEKLRCLILRIEGIDKSVGLVSLPVLVNGDLMHPRILPKNFSCRGQIVSHSVGLVIRKELHNKFGKYSEKYKILSDSLFIDTCLQSGIQLQYLANMVIGEFSLFGISSTQIRTRIDEAYSYHLELGYSKLVQKVYRFLRLTKYIIFKK